MIIVGLLCVSSVMPVGAASDTEVAQAASEFAFRQQCMSLVNTLDDTVELERAEVGISDVPITQKILDNCIATSTDENGKETVLEVKATIRDLGTVTRVLPMKIVVIYTH